MWRGRRDIARVTPTWRSSTRRALIAGALAALLVASVAVVVAWSHGAFESRLLYWREHGQDCGTVNYAPNGMLLERSAADRAVACFATAYAGCKAATLTRNAGGTDTSETDIFVVEPADAGGGCDIGLRYSFGIVGNQRTETHEVQCARVTATNGTLTISGCQGFTNFTMP